MYIILLMGRCQAKSINAYGQRIGDRCSIRDASLARRCRQHPMRDWGLLNVPVAVGVALFETLTRRGFAG